MKLKTTITALLLGSLPIVSAQDAPEKKPAAEEAGKEIKAENPLEVRAFRIFDLVGQFPDVIATIKDKETLTAAEAKLDAITKRLDAEAKEIEGLPVPPNEDRKKLSAKMKLKEKAMNQKMNGIAAAMQNLDPALAQETLGVLSKFSAKMEELGPKMEKHFSPDEEKEEKEEEKKEVE